MASLLLIRELFLLLSICIIASKSNFIDKNSLKTLIIQDHGQLRFANYIGDNMVLQSAPASSIIWGYGDIASEITLSINNKVYHNKTGTEPVNELGDSMWLVVLDPESPGGPFQINVTLLLSNGSLDTISLNNVLFGDVWVCSGQSNMQMAVTDIFNGSVEIANAGNYPKIRLFTGYLTQAYSPQEEPLFIALQWSVASPTSVGGPSFIFTSAVCWLYGRMIYAALGEIPIGLLSTPWPGTPIEAWMPPQALEACNITSSPEPIGSSQLFYGMIYPYTRLVIKGLIWYQGRVIERIAVCLIF
jgi:sialate O-acetylesterase